jgi:hypothetical protein
VQRRQFPRHLLGSGLALAAAALPLGVSAGPAGAGTGPTTPAAVVDTVVTPVGAAAPAALSGAVVPSSEIVGTTAITYHFKPWALAAGWDGPPPMGTCTTANEMATITNITKVSQVVLYRGAVFATVKPGYIAGICFWGTGTHVFRFVLSTDSKRLAITVS